MTKSLRSIAGLLSLLTTGLMLTLRALCATICLTLAGLLTLTTALAQNGPVCSSFTNTDMPGLNFALGIYAVGSTVYVGVNNAGLGISTNGGTTFTYKTTANGLGSSTVNGVYAVGSTVYAATGGGLSISTDGGSTFSNKTIANGLGITNPNVNVVYAVGSTIYAGTQEGLGISTDGGNTFTNKTIANGLGGNVVRGVYAVAGSPNNTVYAATSGGLSISTDGGNTFTNKTTANGLGDVSVNAVYVVGSKVYAATSGGLSISTDGGNTFTNKTTANGLGSDIVRGVYAVGNTVYTANFNGGLSISTDGGNTFTNRTTANGLGSNFVNGVYVVSNKIYTASNGGVSSCTSLPPAAPTNLQRNTAAAYSTTSITLQWIDNSTDEDNFVLERGKRTSDAQLITDPALVWTAVSPNPAANATSFTDNTATGLTANQFGYFYRVKAVNVGGSSAFANSTGGALPVTLTTFTAQPTANRQVALAWQTASEQNADYFAVERSADLLTFQTVGTPKAGGNSSVRLDYAHTDEQPLHGLSYYRLTQVDLNGNRHTYRPVAVRLDGSDAPWPNPSNGQFINLDVAPTSVFTLHSLTGVSIPFMVKPLSDSSVQLVPKVVLPGGVYLIIINGAARKWVVE